MPEDEVTSEPTEVFESKSDAEILEDMSAYKRELSKKVRDVQRGGNPVPQEMIDELNSATENLAAAKEAVRKAKA